MIVNAAEFDTGIFKKVGILKRQRRRRTSLKYLDIVTAFDIETTNLDDIRQSIMYIWQWQIGPEYTVIGRTWHEFRDLVKRISDSLPKKTKMVVYVHNLSFEAQYLKSIIPLTDFIALDNRKVLRCSSGPLEFRCSYLHSNMSLAKFLESMGVEDQKLKDFDYDKKRFPDTELTDRELLYCINDVKGLEEAIRTEMERDGDDLYTIPLTSTGYIRRMAKDSLGGYIQYLKRWLPDLEVMQLLRREFRGGNTHANRWNSNRILEASAEFPINSMDISSSYPYQLISREFPCEFFERDPDKFRVSMKYGKACLMVVELSDVRLKNERWGCPYIARAKCDYIEGGVYDNGRVLQADIITAVFNEIDFIILESEYTFEYKILKLFVARKQKLPIKFRELIMSEYIGKTSLKGVDEYKYSKTKNRFNSLYGMAVQNPIKPQVKYNDTGNVITVDGLDIPPGCLYEDWDQPLEELIEKYHREGWLPYQWGVWCTSYARLELERGLHLIPPDSFIYADTDSIKFVGDYMHRFEELNAQYRNEEYSALDRKGVRHYMGVFEQDNKLPILKFKTMGAKKYCYTDAEGLHLTLSGVSKVSDPERGRRSGAEELGSIEKFQEGFIFRESAGTEALYNDQMEPYIIEYRGRDLEITSNMYIRESTYELGLDYDYYKMLAFLAHTDIRFSMHYER